MKIKFLLLLCSIGCTAFINAFNPLEDLDAALVLDAKTMPGEGSVWHRTENKLYWIDIEGKTLHIYDPVSKGDKIFPVGARIMMMKPVPFRTAGWHCGAAA